jgi:hypothetical protein
MKEIDPSLGMRVSDRIAAGEVCRLCALLNAIDEDLATRGVSRSNGDARSLVAFRARVSGQLRHWCIQLGLTPASRNGIRSSDLVRKALVQTTMISPEEFVRTLRGVMEIAMTTLPEELRPVLAERIVRYIQENR